MGDFLLRRRFAIGLAALGAGLVVGTSGLLQPGLAQPCTSNCGSRQIQFTPGERVRVSVVNRTSSLVQVEQIYGTSPVALLPSQEIEVDPNFGTRPNASLVVWDETDLPLKVRLFRPTANSLRIEVLPGGRPPGDRSIYIEDDGKVRIF
ncbi:MAG: hypothetical protein ACKO7W_05905 [Elainella sp.]